MATTVRDVPVVPGRLPLLGHAHHLLRDPLPLVASLGGHGPFTRFHLGTRPVLFLADLGHVREATQLPDEVFTRERITRNVRFLVGGAVAVLSGTDHRVRRRLLAPSFRSERITRGTAVMSRVAGETVERWQPGQRLLFNETAFDLSLATLTGAMIGVELPEGLGDRIRTATGTIIAGLPSRVLLPKPLLRAPTPGNRRWLAVAAGLRSEFAAIVARYRAEDEDRGDMLSAMLLFRDPETGATLGDDEIVDELIGMVIAGGDSPAGMLAFAIGEIARRPALDEAIRAEALAVAGQEPIALEHVRALELTNRVIAETLRHYAPWINLQDAVTDIEIGGLPIPAGQTVGFSLNLLAHDPAVFENPQRFDPARWNGGEEEADPRLAEHALPFSVGRRKCPGEAFARAELAIQIATIVRRWALRPAPGAPEVVPVPNGVALTPSPMHLVVHAPG